MKIIRAPNLARAHELAVGYVLEHGKYVQTEAGEETLETGPICIEVNTPLAEPMRSDAAAFGEELYAQYARNLIHGTDSVFVYDYHSRLCHDLGKNQIDYIVEKLIAEPNSRRAMAVTWNPPVDCQAADVPCLQLIQCVIRGEKLDMMAVFRSNDMLSAAGANMYGLVSLQKYIAEHVGVQVGTYTHISLVPHVYHERDASDIRSFCLASNCDPAKTRKSGACQACGFGCRNK